MSLPPGQRSIEGFPRSGTHFHQAPASRPGRSDDRDQRRSDRHNAEGVLALERELRRAIKGKRTSLISWFRFAASSFLSQSW
jgi:hypothetical protein